MKHREFSKFKGETPEAGEEVKYAKESEKKKRKETMETA